MLPLVFVSVHQHFSKVLSIQKIYVMICTAFKKSFSALQKQGFTTAEKQP